VDKEALQEFKQGLSLLRNGYPGKALPHLTKAVELEKHNPFYISYLGVATARDLPPFSVPIDLPWLTLLLSSQRPDICMRLSSHSAQPGKFLHRGWVYSIRARILGSEMPSTQASSSSYIPLAWVLTPFLGVCDTCR